MSIFRYFIICSIAALASLPSADSKAEPLLTFGAMGDVPYLPFEDEILPVQIDGLAKDLSFVIHVGDIKSGASPCDLQVYEKVSGMLAKSKIPMFIIPGDNEWNDCTDPAEAWELWVRHFDQFEKRWDLPFKVKRDPQQPPNFTFFRNQVLFIGLSVVGGRVHDADEWKKRHADCLSWVKSQFATHGAKAKAVVVFVHAKPAKNHTDFFEPFSDAAETLGKPVLLLHGDGHRWIHDYPFEAKNVLRVQVDQGGIAPPLRVTVTDDSDEPFQFSRQLENQPLVRRFPVEGLTVGPTNGALVIDGGSGGRDRMKIFHRFVELAGGKNARIVVIPTALGSVEEFDIEDFRKASLGASEMQPASMTMLHTRDRATADSPEFVGPIRNATGIWFGGGRQWRLVDAYGGTRSEREFRKVLERGGAIGGSSAGATIQGSFLSRGDTNVNTIMLGDHQRGFAYLKNVAIDQHVVARGRELDLIKILNDPQGKMKDGHNRRALLGLGIDEGSAVVVTRNKLEVIGKPSGGALIYDPSIWAPTLPDKRKFIRLGPGSIYDLNHRVVLKNMPPAPVPPKKKKP